MLTNTPFIGKTREPSSSISKTQEVFPSATVGWTRQPAEFVPNFQDALLVDVEEIASGKDGLTLVDSRTAERYRGESEPIDPVAGHIPGAVCMPHTAHLDNQGRMLPVAQLRERFSSLANSSGDPVIFYCGSGVTAAHNVLAFTHAYAEMPRLYAGSWSEWITNPARPVARGDEPPETKA